MILQKIRYTDFFKLLYIKSEQFARSKVKSTPIREKVHLVLQNDTSAISLAKLDDMA